MRFVTDGPNTKKSKLQLAGCVTLYSFASTVEVFIPNGATFTVGVVGVDANQYTFARLRNALQLAAGTDPFETSRADDIEILQRRLFYTLGVTCT